MQNVFNNTSEHRSKNALRHGMLVAVAGLVLLVAACSPGTDSTAAASGGATSRSESPRAARGQSETPQGGTIVQTQTEKAPKAQKEDAAMAENRQVATFGLGCFWKPDFKFGQVPGVLKTEVGYCGGAINNPTYRQVCTDTTGHAEVVQVTFDANKVTYATLLNEFWGMHDPTQLNRQGPDYGRQYRSVIFVHDAAQRTEALASKSVLESSGKWSRPVVTQIVDIEKFWPAEEYHQQYYIKQGITSCDGL